MKRFKASKITRKLMLYGIAFSLASTIMSLGCGNNGNLIPAGTCVPGASFFNTFYTNALAITPQAYYEQTNVPADTMQYSFVLNATLNVCQIGYQGNVNMANSNTPYTIQIVDDISNTIVYNANHVFASAMMDYKAVTGVQLTANRDYTIRRITPSTVPAADITGKVINKNGANIFPITNPAMSAFIITRSSLKGRFPPIVVGTNTYIPKIDIVLN